MVCGIAGFFMWKRKKKEGIVGKGSRGDLEGTNIEMDGGYVHLKRDEKE